MNLSGIRKSFRTRTILDGIDLTVSAGEVTVLLGPSGTGKTTLLRIIAGLEPADSGSVTYRGQEILSKTPGQRHVQMVFQRPVLYPFLNVRRNILFPSDPTREGLKELDELCKLLEIGHLLEQWPSKLSGGETQRVALSRALLAKRDLYLLDEPLSSVDPPLAARVRIEVRERLKDRAAPVLYVTHDQDEAFAMGDSIVVMGAGRVQQVGAPPALIDTPATALVGEFVGSPGMSFFTAVCQRANQHIRVQLKGTQQKFDTTGSLEFETPTEVNIGFRSAKLKFAPPLNTDDYLGPYDILGIERGVARDLIQLRSPQKGVWRLPLQSRDDIGQAASSKVAWTSFAGQNLHVFNLATGCSLGLLKR